MIVMSSTQYDYVEDSMTSLTQCSEELDTMVIKIQRRDA